MLSKKPVAKRAANLSRSDDATDTADRDWDFIAAFHPYDMRKPRKRGAFAVRRLAPVTAAGSVPEQESLAWWPAASQVSSELSAARCEEHSR